MNKTSNTCAIAESYGCTVPEFLLGILQIMAKPEVLHNPILGLFFEQLTISAITVTEIVKGW